MSLFPSKYVGKSTHIAVTDHHQVTMPVEDQRLRIERLVLGVLGCCNIDGQIVPLIGEDHMHNVLREFKSGPCKVSIEPASDMVFMRELISSSCTVDDINFGIYEHWGVCLHQDINYDGLLYMQDRGVDPSYEERWDRFDRARQGEYDDDEQRSVKKLIDAIEIARDAKRFLEGKGLWSGWEDENSTRDLIDTFKRKIDEKFAAKNQDPNFLHDDYRQLEERYMRRYEYSPLVREAVETLGVDVRNALIDCEHSVSLEHFEQVLEQYKHFPDRVKNILGDCLEIINEVLGKNSHLYTSVTDEVIALKKLQKGVRKLVVSRAMSEPFPNGQRY